MIAGLIGIWSQAGFPLYIALFELVGKCAAIVADVVMDLHDGGFQMVLSQPSDGFSETTMCTICIYQRAPSLKIIWSLFSRIRLGHG